MQPTVNDYRQALLKKLDRAKNAFVYTARQREAIAAINRIHASGMIPTILYGGAMSGGKSFFIGAYFTDLSERYPNSRYYICRKESVVCKRTTIHELISKVGITSRKGWIHHNSEQYFYHTNGSRIDYGGLGDDSDREKVKSMNLTAAAIDEASEVDATSVKLLSARVGRVTGTEKIACMILASNPEPCYLQSDFVDADLTGTDRAYIQALPSDNPHISKEYIQKLNDIYKDSPDLLDAYVNGIWGSIGTDNGAIDPISINKCMTHTLKKNGIKRWSVDVARYGDDKTTLYEQDGDVVVKLCEWVKKGTDETSDDVIARYTTEENKPIIIIVDADGIGGGFADQLRKAKVPHRPIHSNGKSIFPDKFKNMKAELTWKLRQKIKDLAIQLPNNPHLRQELTAIKYTVDEKKITITPKHELKQRLGRSPDDADAVILLMAASTELTTAAEGDRIINSSNIRNIPKGHVSDDGAIVLRPLRNREKETKKGVSNGN